MIASGLASVSWSRHTPGAVTPVGGELQVTFALDDVPSDRIKEGSTPAAPNAEFQWAAGLAPATSVGLKVGAAVIPAAPSAAGKPPTKSMLRIVGFAPPPAPAVAPRLPAPPRASPPAPPRPAARAPPAAIPPAAPEPRAPAAPDCVAPPDCAPPDCAPPVAAVAMLPPAAKTSRLPPLPLPPLDGPVPPPPPPRAPSPSLLPEPGDPASPPRFSSVE